MKKHIISIFLFSFSTLLFAQVKGIVTDTANQPLPAVGVFWIDTDHHHFTLTEADGNFAIDYCEHENQTKLVVSTVGYQPDTIIVTDKTLPLRIRLRQNVMLDAIEVRARQMGTTVVRNNAIHTTRINQAELHKAACCNLSESFETNASVDVAFTDAATGAKQIRLLGLSGRYVQMLTENAPNFRGVAMPFSLTYIPGS